MMHVIKAYGGKVYFRTWEGGSFAVFCGACIACALYANADIGIMIIGKNKFRCLPKHWNDGRSHKKMLK